MASRYAAVFPLSELINWVYHTRGQRYEELPHSYQMMLFWAGLRGAVGVALAAGITGDNADALRTTILVVVVLTVIIFGGTTARMLEVLGIRVGVEDEDASSDDEEGWTSRPGHLALQLGPGSRRYAGQNGRGMFADHEDIGLDSPADSPYLHPADTQSSRRTQRPKFNVNASRSGFSTDAEDSDDGEPLGSATFDYDEEVAAGGSGGDGGARSAGEPSEPGMIFRDGQWFTALDERYLLPLFSNSVTARRHQARKAKRAHVHGGGGGGPGSDAASPMSPSRGVSLEMGRPDDADEVGSENGKNKFSRTFRYVHHVLNVPVKC